MARVSDSCRRTPAGTTLLILIGTGVWLLSSCTGEEMCGNLFVRKRMGSRGMLSDVYVLKSHPDMAVEKSNQAQRAFFFISFFLNVIINITRQNDITSSALKSQFLG